MRNVQVPALPIFIDPYKGSTVNQFQTTIFTASKCLDHQYNT